MPDNQVNPYDFVAFGLDQRPKGFEEGLPTRHDRVEGNYDYHGRIDVTFEVVTPLLILDESTKSTAGNHDIYSIRRTTSGEVLIPPTSVKGALRSAYEAITNSRLGTPDETMSSPSPNRRYSYYEFVPSHLRPATLTDQFTSAERLFGFVAPGQSSDHAWRGAVKISEITPLKVTIEEFKGGAVALKPLLGAQPDNSPRYLGMKTQVADGDSESFIVSDFVGGKSDRYRDPNSQVLRGRKMYWHHTGVDWSTGVPQSLRSNQKNDKNRSIKEWVATGSQFRFSLHLSNITEFDLSALIWLLHAASGEIPAHLHMGFGAPFGFGSVKVLALDLTLETSEQRRQRWAELRPLPANNADPAIDVPTFASNFIYFITPNGGEQPQFITDYLRIRQGEPGSQIAYPTGQQGPRRR